MEQVIELPLDVSEIFLSFLRSVDTIDVRLVWERRVKLTFSFFVVPLSTFELRHEFECWHAASTWFLF